MADINRKRKRKKRRRRLNLAPVCLLLGLILAGLVLLAWQLNSGTALDRWLPMGDVTVGSLSLEGMTKAQAKEALGKLAQAGLEPLVIHIGEDTHSYTATELGIEADTDGAVDELWRSKTAGKVSLLPCLGLEEETLRQLVASLETRYNRAFSQTLCFVSGSRPDLTAEPRENEPGQVLTVTLGQPEFGLDGGELYERILRGYEAGNTEITAQYRYLEPTAPDLEGLWQQTYVAPVDAVLDEKTFEVTPEVWGYGFDLEAAAVAVGEAEYGQTVTVPFSRIEAEHTAQEVGGHLYRDVLGEARTPYKGTDDNDRNTNLALACQAINGLVLMPGETFSYNEALGERTAKKGYRPAPSYEGGLTVDTLGGGICQISSTLYYSTLFADLEIVRRYNHGYVSDYIDPGMDATVTWGGADFRFKNNTEYPIRIEAWRADGYVNIKLWGTDTRDYYVKMTYKILSRTGYSKVYREMTAGNSEGYRDGDTIVTPYEGMTVRAYKEKYSRATGELISRAEESYNEYKSRDWVVCRIVTETTAPTEKGPGENETPVY